MAQHKHNKSHHQRTAEHKAHNHNHSGRSHTPSAPTAPPQNLPTPHHNQTAACNNALTCPHAKQCGACQHIHLPYEQQLATKNETIAHLFNGIAHPATIRPILGMEYPYYYRNKVIAPYAPGKKIARTAHAANNRSNKTARQRHTPQEREILCGMYAHGTHHIVPTDACLIENKQAKQVILEVKRLMSRFGITPYNENTGSGFLRHAVLRVGHTSGEVLVTLVTNAEVFPASKAFCRELVKRCPFITSIVQNINTRQTNVILGTKEQRLYGPGFILDTLCGLSFRISSQSFYQVNAVQTEVLYNTAIQLAHLTGTERVMDAYCGTGTIGLVAAQAGAAEVVGVDSVPAAIHDARQNAAHNGVKNAQFVAADAGGFMCEEAACARPLDVLLMDPPRAGASEAFLVATAQLQPKRIVYISCNPKTQARDITTLIARGYEVTAVQPVDMFPHTEHIECVVLLSRK